MAPFFIVFFGVMMADMGYGLLMMAGTQFVLRKTKPKNPNFMELFFWCGVSTFIVGALKHHGHAGHAADAEDGQGRAAQDDPPGDLAEEGGAEGPTSPWQSTPNMWM